MLLCLPQPGLSVSELGRVSGPDRACGRAACLLISSAALGLFSWGRDEGARADAGVTQVTTKA